VKCCPISLGQKVPPGQNLLEESSQTVLGAAKMELLMKHNDGGARCTDATPATSQMSWRIEREPNGTG